MTDSDPDEILSDELIDRLQDSHVNRVREIDGHLSCKISGIPGHRAATAKVTFRHRNGFQEQTPVCQRHLDAILAVATDARETGERYIVECAECDWSETYRSASDVFEGFDEPSKPMAHSDETGHEEFDDYWEPDTECDDE